MLVKLLIKGHSPKSRYKFPDSKFCDTKPFHIKRPETNQLDDLLLKAPDWWSTTANQANY
jgi:hypothetical protein